MSKNKLTTYSVSLFLGIVITTSTIFSALVIVFPINSVFAEQIDNSQEKTMLEKLRAMYYSSHNNEKTSKYNNYKINGIKTDTNNHITEIFQESPTKDKKQFCEIGQFKGFYVSSAEFCNLEIPSGPAGPMSPAGPTLFPPTRVYSVGGPIVNSGTFPESIATSETICDI